MLLSKSAPFTLGIKIYVIKTYSVGILRYEYIGNMAFDLNCGFDLLNNTVHPRKQSFHTYVTDRPTLVATVPVGYADGYRRSLSNQFYVLICGKKAPILGRVCMDQLMVDVTHIPGVQVNDQVTLVGTDGEEAITMEQAAEAAGSFNYEFVCGISRRVPRYYYRDGQVVHQVHYLLDTEK